MSIDTATEPSAGSIGAAFKPRRLGHTNCQVSDLEQSIKFYNDIIGYDVVYRKTNSDGKVVGGFFSNGNTYHDLAVFVNEAPGVLNHPAYECSTEVDLIAGYRLAVEAGVHFDIADHVVARSLYSRDPDGQMVEVYADTTPEWRENRGDGRTVGPDSLDWTPGDPGRFGRPLDAHNYPVDVEFVRLEHSVFQAKRMLYVALATQDLARLVDYYVSRVGLHVLLERDGYAVLAGTTEEPSVVLLEAGAGESVGMHHMGTEVFSLERGFARLAERGLDVDAFKVDDTLAVIADPDGLVVSLFEEQSISAEGIFEIAKKLRGRPVSKAL